MSCLALPCSWSLSFLCSFLDFECRVCCQCLTLLYSHISQWFTILSLSLVWTYCIQTSRLGNIVLDVFPPLETPSNHYQALFHITYMLSWHVGRSIVEAQTVTCYLTPPFSASLKAQSVHMRIHAHEHTHTHTHTHTYSSVPVNN